MNVPWHAAFAEVSGQDDPEDEITVVEVEGGAPRAARLRHRLRPYPSLLAST